MLLHLPPMDGRDGPRTKNGPALTGAAAVRDAIAEAIVTLPEHLRRSLTWALERDELVAQLVGGAAAWWPITFNSR